MYSRPDSTRNPHTHSVGSSGPNSVGPRSSSAGKLYPSQGPGAPSAASVRQSNGPGQLKTGTVGSLARQVSSQQVSPRTGGPQAPGAQQYHSLSHMVANPLATYKARKDSERIRVLQKYEIVGYIAAGTYGRVYKAKSKTQPDRVFAIKKFKADKEGEVVNYTGISQSACREMALCRELNHHNITKLEEIILEDKSIYMVFDYAEHDLLQIIHFHSHPERKPIPESIVKSVMWQLLNGVSYLHQNWVLHRDLKPANIMLTNDGVVKIGDLGLARLFSDPLQSLFVGDKVVVTIWYRAPELLLGARHYTPAVDLWAVGCIFAELLSLRPIFKGEEVKMDKKNVPFQRNQTQKVIEILGTPSADQWPSLPKYPEYPSLQAMKMYPPNLENWYRNVGCTNQRQFELLSSLLEYDPAKRITADEALLHPFFTEPPKVTQNVFEGQSFDYPNRRISNEDNDIKASVYANKRAAADDGLHPRKKHK